MTWRYRVARWLREPLLHFALIGAALFGLYSARAPVDADSRTITITAPQVSAMASEWSSGWNRAPTPAEIDGLIRDYIKDEVYTREAKRLGLDRDDAVVRRRMRTRMEFLATSAAEDRVPTTAELQSWLTHHAADYAQGPTLSFDQVYVGGSNAGAAVMLAKIVAGGDPATLGVHTSLPSHLEVADSPAIENSFGTGFAAAVAGLPLGRWAGPVESGVGWHLVRLRARAPGHAPALADVRREVENDWRADYRRSAEVKAYQALLDGYTIHIRKPD